MNKISADEKSRIAEAGISRCHDRLISMYPDLRIRWSRVYGKRRAHLMGSKTEISYSACYMDFDGGYELCIENPGILGDGELDGIKKFINAGLSGEGED